MAMLVCEGACNPGIAKLDAEVELARRCAPQEVLSLLSDSTMYRLHHLVHTPHSHAGYVNWRCDVCGSIRRWGM